MTRSPDISSRLLQQLEHAGTSDIEVVCDGLPVVISQSETSVTLYIGTGVDCSEYGVERVLGQFSPGLYPSKIILSVNPEDNCWWMLRYLEVCSRSELIPILTKILNVRDEFRYWLFDSE